MPKENIKAPEIDSAWQESIEDRIKSDKQERNQRRMEKEVQGSLKGIPGAVNLPGKPNPEPKDWRDAAPPLSNPTPEDAKKLKMTPPLSNPKPGDAKKLKMILLRKGGYVKAADGIAKKGKTKGRIL